MATRAYRLKLVVPRDGSAEAIAKREALWTTQRCWHADISGGFRWAFRCAASICFRRLTLHRAYSGPQVFRVRATVPP